VRLIPPSYVKPYVRRSKTDAADAAAICEVVGRPSLRFVPVKSADQQAGLLHHRARDLLVRQRTMMINALRGHLGEFGIIAPVDGIVWSVLSARCTPLATQMCRRWHAKRCKA
jgi:transposase